MSKRKPPAISVAVTRIVRADVEPGDVIVVEVPGIMSQRQQDLVSAQLQAIWPHNRTLVLTNGMTLKIGVVPPTNGTRKRGVA